MTWFVAPEPQLPDLIARHGRWRAARTALIEGDRRLNWHEFEQLTARAANFAVEALKRGDV